ncbi:MAG: hypothetical protein NW220_21125 [Leptolyngbyaceae cyanobacterium bins.349]|nr:hypothetical protein [Leptolyngbyaceae cyanobacterium bins.349]
MSTIALASLHLALIEPATWAQAFTVLLVGLLTALALQVVLLSLGGAIAIGTIQRLGSAANQRSSPFPRLPLPMGAIIGLMLCLTVNLVLFVSSFLGVAFTHFSSVMQGAIAGLLLWAAYLLLVLWVGFKTFRSLIEACLTSVVAGFRRVFSIFASRPPQSSDRSSSEASPRDRSSSEDLSSGDLSSDASDGLQAEITAAEPIASQPSQAIWGALEQHLQRATPKQLTTKNLDRTLQHWQHELIDPAVEEVPAINYSQLEAILAERNDLSSRKKTRILQQIQATWETWSRFSSSHHQGATNGVTWAETLETVATSLASPVVQEQVQQLVEQSQVGMTQVQQAFGAQAEHLRERTTEQMAEVQQTVQMTLQTHWQAMQQEAQNGLRMTRKTAASIVWWFVATTVTGGLSATLAGAIAAGFNPMRGW